MKWRELKIKAEEHGYVFKRHGKKHDIYENPATGSLIQIERHWSQEVRRGLLTVLKREIGF